MENTNSKLSALDALKKGAEQGRAEAEKASGDNAPKPVKPHTSPRKTLTQVKPQMKLGLAETKYFNAIADFLGAAGLLEVVDSLLLTMLARNYTVWRELSEDLTPATMVTVLPNGIETESIQSKMARDAENQVMKISAKLGLSPADRSKMIGQIASAEMSKKQQQKGDDLEAYL